jgi:hypothetical protein
MTVRNGTYVSRSFPLWAWGENALTALKDVSPGASMIVTLVTGTVMIVGAAVGTTWHLSDAINQSQRASQYAIDSALNRIAADEAKAASVEERLTYVEKEEAEHYASDVSRWDKIDSQNAIMLQALADLKVQLATKENIRVR